MREVFHILLADDSPFFRTIERQFLQNTPAEIIEASDSEEVFTALRGKSPDLIFLAYSLRPENGVECCLKIKRDPDLCNLPIVLICDQYEEEQVGQAQRSGADAVLVKPLDRHLFLKTGRRFLDSIREPRHGCLIKVQFISAGEVCKGTGLDISSGGMFLDTAVSIRVGEVVDLSFGLPGHDMVLVKCKGLVTWTNYRPSPIKPHYPSGFGVKFIDLPEVLKKSLNTFKSR